MTALHIFEQDPVPLQSSDTGTSKVKTTSPIGHLLHPILVLQRRIGNQDVLRSLQRGDLDRDTRLHSTTPTVSGGRTQVKSRPNRKIPEQFNNINQVEEGDLATAPSRLQRAGTGDGQPVDEWITRMRTLRDAALGEKMTRNQEQTFVEGLNEVIKPATASPEAALIHLPIETMPVAKDEFDEGHVYFDKTLDSPGVTKTMCKLKGTKGFVPEEHYVPGKGYVKGTCASEAAVGDVIFLGPLIILDTVEFARSVFDHEAIHYSIGVKKRSGAMKHPIQGRYNEEILGYAEEFARILLFSKEEMQSTVRKWMYYYALADDVRAQRWSELKIRNNLLIAFRRAGAQASGDLVRATLAEAKVWATTDEAEIDPSVVAAVKAAVDRVVSTLDLIEGRPAPGWQRKR